MPSALAEGFVLQAGLDAYDINAAVMLQMLRKGTRT